MFVFHSPNRAHTAPHIYPIVVWSFFTNTIFFFIYLSFLSLFTPPPPPRRPQIVLSPHSLSLYLSIPIGPTTSHQVDRKQHEIEKCHASNTKVNIRYLCMVFDMWLHLNHNRPYTWSAPISGTNAQRGPANARTPMKHSSQKHSTHQHVNMLNNFRILWNQKKRDFFELFSEKLLSI